MAVLPYVFYADIPALPVPSTTASPCPIARVYLIFASFPASPPVNLSSSLCIVCSFHFTDHPTSSHSAVSVSHSAFVDDEEFSDFIQGPVETPKAVPQPSSQPFQPFHSGAEAGQLLSGQAVVQTLPPAQAPGLPILHATTGQVPYFPTSASSPSIHKTGKSEVSFFLVTFCHRATQSFYLFCWVFFQSGRKK